MCMCSCAPVHVHVLMCSSACACAHVILLMCAHSHVPMYINGHISKVHMHADERHAECASNLLEPFLVLQAS